MSHHVRRVLLTLTMGCLCFPVSSLGHTRTPHPVKTSVKFLAQGVAVYSSFSGNRTDYLVEIVGSDKKTHFARLVYERPTAHPELTEQILGIGRVRTLPLLRSQNCDVTYSNFSTLWLPGYRETVYRAEGLHFYPKVNRLVIAEDEVLPCYLLPANRVRWHGFEAVIR
jgi:hypothetical protein